MWLIWSSADPTCCRYPSWVCRKETALLTLALAAEVWPICAFKAMDSANPAGSSDGFTILEPDESRASDSFNSLVDLIEVIGGRDGRHVCIDYHN